MNGTVRRIEQHLRSTNRIEGQAMGHEFPKLVNWQSTSSDIMTEHAVYLFMILCSIICLFASRRWPAKQVAIWGWTIAIVVMPIAIAATEPRLDPDIASSHWSYFATYTLVFWGISIVGMLQIHRKLRRSEQKSQLGCAFEVLGMLGGMWGFIFLAPYMGTPKEAGHRSQCKSNLRQIGIALHNFHEVHGHLPASGKGEPPVSWRVHALPYLDNPDLFETYDQTLAWNSDKNTVIAKQRNEQLTCPSTQTTKDTLDRWYTHYAMVSGQKTIGDRQNPRSFSDFTDGTSNTLAVVEAAGLNIVWTEPRDSEVSDGNLGINLTGPTPTESPALISAWHRGGGHVLMADGAAKFLSHNIDPKVLKALTTVDGDDSIEGWDAR